MGFFLKAVSGPCDVSSVFAGNRRMCAPEGWEKQRENTINSAWRLPSTIDIAGNTLQRFGASNPTLVQNPVKERVRKLRQEIADISEANQQYMNRRSRDATEAGQQVRRLQRLQGIMDELRRLTEWKET
jgi:hypothetical protein